MTSIKIKQLRRQISHARVDLFYAVYAFNNIQKWGFLTYEEAYEMVELRCWRLDQLKEDLKQAIHEKLTK